MRCSKWFRGSAVVSLAVSLGGAFAHGSAGAAEPVPAGFGTMLGGLVEASDLEKRAVSEDHWTDAAGSVSVKSMARQSVPVENRASFYRVREVFTFSKVAMPLLVADLEPSSVLHLRPMSGHSVGAAPSARWTRSVSIVEVAPESSR